MLFYLLGMRSHRDDYSFAIVGVADMLPTIVLLFIK